VGKLALEVPFLVVVIAAPFGDAMGWAILKDTGSEPTRNLGDAEAIRKGALLSCRL